MTRRQSEAARRRHQREAKVLCPVCTGSGLILGRTIATRARKGGNTSYLKSLQVGQLSMSERGKRGGAPRMPTIEDIQESN